MHRAQRFRRIVLLNDRRDVSLRRSLRDRAHVDSGFAERVEKFPGDTGALDHPVTNHGQDAAFIDDPDSLYCATANLSFERIFKRLFRQARLVRRYGETDRVLGAGLRNHHDGNTHGVQRPEEFVRDAGDAAHAGALDIDQGHVIYGRESFDRRFKC